VNNSQVDSDLLRGPNPILSLQSH